MITADAHAKPSTSNGVVVYVKPENDGKGHAVTLVIALSQVIRTSVISVSAILTPPNHSENTARIELKRNFFMLLKSNK